MKKYYERYWDEKESMGDFKIKWKAVSENIPQGKNIQFLDFGCGKGLLLSEILKENPHLKATGVDISKNAILNAKKRLPSAKFKVIREGERLPFKENAFDYILAADVLEHIYDTD